MITRLTCITLLAMVSPVAAAPSGPPIKATDVDFVVTEANDSGKVTSLQIPIVTYRVGNCYAWVIRFAPASGTARIVEHFRLPGRAPIWNIAVGETGKVGRRRRSAKTPLTIDLSSGVATHGWCIAKGDPFGVHRFTIKQGSRTLHQFVFNIGEVL